MRAQILSIDEQKQVDSGNRHTHCHHYMASAHSMEVVLASHTIASPGLAGVKLGLGSLRDSVLAGIKFLEGLQGQRVRPTVETQWLELLARRRKWEW